MFGRGKSEVVPTPTKEKMIEPYATVKRIGLFKWRVDIRRGKDDEYNEPYYRYHSDPIKYFNGYYYYWSEAKAERKAKILLSKAKDRIDWSRTVKRFDVK